MIVMGVETSCDETSVAIVEDGRLLSTVVFSQVGLHEKFGGIVPEVASRDHIKKIPVLTKEAMNQANIAMGDVSGIAVTSRPGLIGSLLVGLSFSKALAYYNRIPFIGINHLEAHLFSVFLENAVPFPFIGLTVSGGHTSLSVVKDYMNIESIGVTYDDAAGEAYDKIAGHLGLGYPGGPKLEKFAQMGDPLKISFPKPLVNSKDEEDKFNFSFSGLKSSVVNYLFKNPGARKEDVAASFQYSVIEVLSRKLKMASGEFGINNIVLAGGVACNKALREKIKKSFPEPEYKVFIPSPKYCTDNAAMIALLGYHYLKAGRHDELNLNASSRV